MNVPDFGAHASWVWSAYGATVLILGGLALLSWSALRRASTHAESQIVDAPQAARAVRIDDA